MRVKDFLFRVFAVLFLLLPCLPLVRVSASPAIGSTITTIDAVADAYVNSSSPETNYGDLDELYVSTNSEEALIYVMFDLSGLPSEAIVLSAQLKLYITDIGGYVGDISVHHCADSSWTEQGITWNNKPDFAAEATDSNYFGMIVWTGYRSWDVTPDLLASMSQGKLSEVIVRETSGHATFESIEATHEPRLEVEYSVKPVYLVGLQSVQDIDATANFGFITVAEEMFSLPCEVQVVNGSYPVVYSGGYKFVRWESTGGVTVEQETSESTVVSVTGNGTLRAVGSAEELEYAYDHGNAEAEYASTGEIDAVQFTPLFSGQLLRARFYMYDVSTSSAFKVHVMDKGRDLLITPFNVTPGAEGWFDVDLSAYNLSVAAGEDFYVGMEWIKDYDPDLGEDSTNASLRSWRWDGEFWDVNERSDYMIRAVVGSAEQPPPVEVGVKPGDWMGYGDVFFEYASNMPGYEEPPAGMDMAWMDMRVVEVSDGEVALSSMVLYRNGTEETQISSGNPATGEGNLSVGVIPLGLAAGDEIPAVLTWYTEEPLRLFINGTVTRRYAHAEREMNYVNISQPITYGNETYGALNLSFYWDKQTGVLCEEFMSYRTSYMQNMTRYYMNMTLLWRMTGTNMWPAVFTAQDGYAFDVSITGNSTISAFSFNEATKQISFNVTGLAGKMGYCNVTIPKDLLKGVPWTVYVNNTDVTASCSITENATHAFLFIPYALSTKTIMIVGTWAIPEFPLALILPLLVMVTSLVAVARRRKNHKQ